MLFIKILSLTIVASLIVASLIVSGQSVSTGHMVKKGDTLYNIAKRYNTTVEQIRALNGLGKSGVIKIGARLQIPREGSSTLLPALVNLYTIRKGDTLSKVARAHGITLGELLILNPDLEDKDNISPGQSVVVSGSPGEPLVKTAFYALGQGEGGFDSYAGETIAMIAESIGRTPSQIYQKNPHLKQYGVNQVLPANTRINSPF